MAAPNMHNIPSAQPNMNGQDMSSSDICYAPSAPMQSAPPPLYPMVAPPVPYAMVPQAQISMYRGAPVVMTHIQVPYQGVVITNGMYPPQTAAIKDYMVWSIINVFLGGCVLGLIAVLLSAQTKKRKQEGDVQGARTMSNITLTCNILITIICFVTTAFLIVFYIITLPSLDT